jgi:hypothetical protein
LFSVFINKAGVVGGLTFGRWGTEAKATLEGSFALDFKFVSRGIQYEKLPKASLRMASPCQVTELLRRWSNGDQEALNSLVPLVYEDLRR